MAASATKTPNIFQKLAKARLDFLSANIQKTGINKSGEYEYFELKDIVPIGTEILNKNGLIFVVSFPAGVPCGTLYDFDSDATMTFSSALVEGDITGPKGGALMSSIQSEGAKQTYHRRYLWMQVLDIVAQDEIDGGSFTEPSKPKKTSKKPVSEEKRAEIKKEITDSEGAAEEIQIEQLKKALKTLNDESDGEYEEFITEIAVKTENFTNLSKKNCEELIIQIATLIEENKKGVVE